MKKFGTPSGAGPGSAKENVGLDGVGTPPRLAAGGLDGCLALVVVVLDGCLGLLVVGGLDLVGLVEPWCEEGCDPPGPVVLGGGEGEVEVEVVPPPERLCWRGGGELDVVVVPVLVVEEPVEVEPDDDCGQDSETDLTGDEMFSEEIGAPGGSWKYRVCPVIRTTVTVQLAAEAAGNTATPKTPPITASVASATRSWTRLNTGILSSRGGSSAAVSPRQDRAVADSQASY